MNHFFIVIFVQMILTEGVSGRYVADRYGNKMEYFRVKGL